MKAFVMYYTTNGKYALFRNRPPGIDGYVGRLREVEIDEDVLNQLEKHLELGEQARKALIDLWWKAE